MFETPVLSYVIKVEQRKRNEMDMENNFEEF